MSYYQLPEPDIATTAFSRDNSTQPYWNEKSLKATHAAGRASRDAEVETLRAESDQLQRDFNAELQGNAKLREILGAKGSETMFEFANRFVDEREALRADAERYRFLQSNAYVGIAPYPKPHEVWCLRLPNPKDAANLDQAIDAAITAARAEQEDK
jgi:hypothetical protein